MTKIDGARFRIGAKTEQEQTAYYTAKEKPLPDWIGYSEEVKPPHKVDDEIVAMRLVHDDLPALGPAIYDVTTYQGIILSSHIFFYLS